jgi:hypothetical protein
MKMRFLFLSLFVATVHARQMTPPFFSFLETDFLKKDEDGELKRCEIWAIGYRQHASSAFIANSSPQKQSMSALFFGQQNFAPLAAFANQTATSQIFLFANRQIAPRVKWHESGVLMGATFQIPVSDEWSVGGKVELPWKQIEVEKETPGLPGASLFGGDTINSVFLQSTADGVNDFAARLDFVAQLPSNCTPNGLQFLLLNFSNPVFGNVPTINEVNLTETMTAIDDQNPITVIYETSSNFSPPFFVDLGQTLVAPPNTARGLPILSGDGTEANGVPLAEGDRARFASTVSYLPLATNLAAQEDLWLVPSVLTTPTLALTNRAAVVGSTIQQLLACVEQSPEEQFLDSNLSFLNTRSSGIGDLSTAICAWYQPKSTTVFEANFGCVFPTSKRLSKIDAASLFKLPVGANGHVQIFNLIGVEYEPCRWFEGHIKGSYYSVLSAPEWIPAAFTGAAVKNLGPITRADISWGYLLIDVDALIRIPVDCAGGSFFIKGNYQYYNKSKDKITYQYAQFPDWSGSVQTLSGTVAALDTHAHAHTFACMVGCSLKYFEIGGGFHAVVAGTNVPVTRGWSVGFISAF